MKSKAAVPELCLPPGLVPMALTSFLRVIQFCFSHVKNHLRPICPQFLLSSVWESRDRAQP